MIVGLKNDMFFNTTKNHQFYFVVWIKFHKNTLYFYLFVSIYYKYKVYFSFKGRKIYL